jgi:hypothetical protein
MEESIHKVVGSCVPITGYVQQALPFQTSAESKGNNLLRLVYILKGFSVSYNIH